MIIISCLLFLTLILVQTTVQKLITVDIPEPASTSSAGLMDPAANVTEENERESTSISFGPSSDDADLSSVSSEGTTTITTTTAEEMPTESATNSPEGQFAPVVDGEDNQRHIYTIYIL
jgi:hypothetical protein